MEIPNSVTYIGTYAFAYCSGLTSVVIPNSVTSIRDYTFSYCNGLTSVVIPNSVTSIGTSAFDGCRSLTSVVIPNSVTSIGDYAFEDCSGLTSVSIGNSVISIGHYAFYNCSGLKSVEIPNSVTKIGQEAFAYCSGLTSVEIPNSVTSIGKSAFSGCSGLTSVEIPNSVTSIGNYAFYGCGGLTSVEIPNSVTKIGYAAFAYCSGLTSVEIPNSVTKIDDYAFYDCSGLKLAFFNAKNCSFNNSVFSSSDLTLVIGADVEQIGSGLLTSSNATKIVTQAATPPVITAETFYDKSCPLYALQGSYAKYWTTDIWEDFTDMRLIDNPITKIELNKSYLNLVANNSAQLSATITPSNATLSDIYWVSDNPAIASVDQNGKVMGLKTGITTITAMAIDGSGAKATCEVSVATIIAENLTLNPSELTLAINQSANITPVITPDNATSTSLEWSTSNAGVASFKANSDGSITVLGAADGVATITCRTTDGSYLTATCTVTVGTVAENLTLNPSELTLAINQSAKITPVITPDNATSTSYEWSTSNAGVAPFKANSDGTISVLGAADGVATITCHTTDGSDLTATCTVTVGTGAVDGIEADAVTVRGENGMIRVEGVDGAQVEVFNTAGVCIYSGTDTEIYVPQRGLYVVKVAGRATKLAL